MPRELVRHPDHDRGRSLGHFAWAWLEHFCVHGNGDVQGQTIELDGEFGGFIVDAYALTSSGRKLYDAAVISRAKGRAKSELAGFFVLFEAFGPCRFDRWASGGEIYRQGEFEYEYLPGEPIGKLVTYPFIRCIATEDNQSGNTYDNVLYNLREGPLSEGLKNDAVGLTRVLLPDGGEIRPSTSASASKDGGKETFVVFDETHLYVTERIREMYRTVERNCRKRREAQGWTLQTTTMYQPGEGSVAEKTHERSRLIAEGKVRGGRLLYDHREAPPDVDLTDKSAVIAALKEVYGPFAEHMDLEGVVENEFWNIERDVEDSRRYFFNQPMGARDAWVSHIEWEACADLDKLITEEDPLVMFFDGSKSDDATGLVGCDVKTGHVMTLGVWEKPANARPGAWQVDRQDVDRVVREVITQRNVVAFFADVAFFENYIDTWAQDFGEQMIIPASSGRVSHPIAWDMRGKMYEFTEACQRMLVDIKDKAVTHDGDSRLGRHIKNARRRPNKYGVSISKEGRESPHKIDLAVCAIGARMVRRLLLASPQWAARQTQASKRRSGRVYGWS